MNTSSESITNYEKTEIYQLLNQGRGSGGIQLTYEEWQDKLQEITTLRYIQLMFSNPGVRAKVDAENVQRLVTCIDMFASDARFSP